MTSVSKHINEMKKRYDVAIHIQELQSLLRRAEVSMYICCYFTLVGMYSGTSLNRHLPNVGTSLIRPCGPGPNWSYINAHTFPSSQLQTPHYFVLRPNNFPQWMNNNTKCTPYNGYNTVCSTVLEILLAVSSLVF